MRRLAIQVILLWSLALVPAVLAALYHPKKPQWSTPQEHAEGRISLREALDPLRDVLWIDARDASAFQRDHVPGALPLNEDRWESLLQAVLEAWRPGCTIIVYCEGGTCESSRQVARRLAQESGLEGIYVLDGGWRAWQQRQR